MPSSKSYLNFIQDQLSALEGVTYRAMMAEYLLYVGGKLVGGIYDQRTALGAFHLPFSHPFLAVDSSAK